MAHGPTDAGDGTHRRRFLKTLGALSVTGLAGCGGDGDGDTSPTDTTAGTGTTTTAPEADTPTDTQTATATSTATSTPVFSDDPALLLSLSDSAQIEPGGTATVTGTIENPYLFEVTNGEFAVELPDGWSVSAVQGATFGSLDQQSEQAVEWEITAPESASEGVEATVTGTYSGPGGRDAAEVSTTLSIVVFTPGDVPTDGLEAYYPLDADTPTNQVTGAAAEVVGDPTTGASGVVESAYEFTMDGTETDRSPGVADALVSGEDLPLNGEGATVGAWFRYSEHEPYSRVYQVGGGLGSGEGVGGIPGFETTFIDQGDDIRIYSTGGDTGAILTLTPDTWYFVVSVVDGDAARLHVFEEDGEVDGSPATGSAGRDQSDAEPLLLTAGDQAETTGRIDEVRAYSRALSEQEVTSLYGGSGGSV